MTYLFNGIPIDVEDYSMNQYDVLLDLVKKASEAYYNNQPFLSDGEFDRLSNLILKKEYSNGINSENAFCNTIGATPPNAGEVYTRKLIMSSMKNAYNLQELEKWCEKVKTKLGKDTLFHVSLKVDGVSLAVMGKDHKKLLLTRGDGVRGTVLNNPELEKVVDNALLRFRAPYQYEIRGEVFLTRENFKKVNEIKKQEGEELYSNPRNAASGIVMSNSPLAKYLSFCPWEIVHVGTERLNTALEQYGRADMKDYTHLHKDMSPDSYEIMNKFFRSTLLISNIQPELKEFYLEMNKNKNEFPIPTDGLVIQVNDIKKGRTLGGYNTKYPNYIIALKYPPEEAISFLEDITFTIARTGVLSPLAVIQPVVIGGTTISKITLHNLDYIKSKGLCVGNQVTVIRSGDVIPKIIKNCRTDKSIDFQPPTTCPSCSAQLVVDGVDLKCINLSCKAQLAEKIVYFFSKQCIGVKGIGVEYAYELIEYFNLDQLVDLSQEMNYITKLFTQECLDYYLTSGKGKIFYNNLMKFIPNLEKDKYRILSGLGFQDIGISLCRKLELDKVDEKALSELATDSKFISKYKLNKNSIESLSKNGNVFYNLLNTLRTITKNYLD